MEEIMKEVSNTLIANIIGNLIEKNELEDFLEFGRAKAKEDGMDTKELMDFFDGLEKNYCDNIEWNKIFEIVNETTNRECMGFRQDKCIIINNRTLSNDEVEDYMVSETAPIHLGNLNKALEPINVQLEFIEAISNPFDLDGFQNFVRFRVVELDK